MASQKQNTPSKDGSGKKKIQVRRRYVTIQPCEVCGKDDFVNALVRGRHMFLKHNIPGSSPTAKAKRQKGGFISSPIPLAPLPLISTQDSFSSDGAGISSTLDGAAHRNAGKAYVIVGRFIEQIHHEASSLGIPPQELARTCAEVFFFETHGVSPVRKPPVVAQHPRV